MTKLADAPNYINNNYEYINHSSIQVHMCSIWIKNMYNMHAWFEREILLDCDVLFACIIFSCIILSAFSFLSACIKDPISIWDPFNIILIVTGIEAVIGNSLPKVHKILPNFRNWGEKFPIIVDDASYHLSCFSWTHASIWHRYGDMVPQR